MPRQSHGADLHVWECRAVCAGRRGSQLTRPRDPSARRGQGWVSGDRARDSAAYLSAQPPGEPFVLVFFKKQEKCRLQVWGTAPLQKCFPTTRTASLHHTYTTGCSFPFCNDRLYSCYSFDLSPLPGRLV